MENVVLTQLSIPELGQLFQNVLDDYFADKQIVVAPSEHDEIGGIELAMEITGKAKPTIYALTSNSQMPHFKRGKKLYFSRNDLNRWLRDGKRKTQRDFALEADNFSSANQIN